MRARPRIAEIHTTEPDKATAVAAVYQAVLARSAGSIINDRLDNDPVSFLHVIDSFPDFFDNAAELMPQRQWYLLARNWMGCRWHDIGATQIFV